MNSNHARSWQQSPNRETAPKQKQVVIKVRRTSLVTRGEKVLYAFFCFMFIIACFYIVSFSSTMDSLNRDVQSLEQNVEVQKVTNDNLVIEIKELSKPERITKIAKENGLKIQNTEVKKANPLK